MAVTLFQRLLGLGDPNDPDEYQIDRLQFASCMDGFAGGVLAASAMKTAMGLTTAQGTDLDAVLATRPAAPLLLLNVPAYVQWAAKISAVVALGQYAMSFTTVSTMRVAMGLSP